MTAHSNLRQQIVACISTRQPGDLAAQSVQWWTAMAAELTPLVGEDGFKLLFRRSLALAHAHFPWLDAQLPDPTFDALTSKLTARSAHDADQASMELMFIFADLLAGLIGEALTSRIIHAAWGDPAATAANKGEHHD